ncbi:MAG: hypothetical protein ACJA2C_002207 [Marinoscillum sp.]|jgi:hypothetical protein
MKNRYKVELLEMKEIHELPEAWGTTELLELLKSIDYQDAESIPADELKDMTAMALSDFEVLEAAEMLLSHRLGENLSKGQRKNLAAELKEDRIWEEYSELSFHKELFNVCTILHWAFPKKYAEPDIVRIQLKVTALNKVAITNLQKLDKSFVARLLNDGMDAHNIIYRLFDEQIASDEFPESEHIIWKLEELGYHQEEQSNILSIYTSWNWVDELKGIEEYESSAFADGQLE